MRRYIETLYRYWYLAILPVLVLPVGSFVLLKTPPTTYGTANIWVDQNSLQQLNYVNTSLLPSQNMAAYITTLFFSPAFDYGVARRTPRYEQYLRSLPHARGLTPNLRLLAAADLTKYATVTPNGTSVVTISYQNPNPAIPALVVRSILQEAAYETAQLDLAQQAKNISYYNGQLTKAQTAYTTAVGNLGTYMTDHGIRSSQLASQQLSDPQLAALYQAVQTDQTNLTAAQQALTKVETQQTSQGAIRVLDPPSAKIVLTSRTKELMGLAIPFVLGLILGLAFIVIMTVRDRSMRSADDVTDLLGIPVLAVVPYTKGPAGSHKTRPPRTAPAAREA